MIKIKEAGQAFILVLIILAIGAVLIVPALRLTNTGLQSSQIISRKNTGLYAAEAAQHKIMWMLFRGTLAANLTSDVPVSFTVDVCGAIVNATIVMRVVESKEGIILAGDDTIMVSKTVSPDSVVPPDNYKVPRLFTYEIELEQVSSNNTASLEAIYDILPSAFGKQEIIYVQDSSWISIDGGEWQHIDDPLKEEQSDQLRLRWPRTGSFDSSFGHFEPAQVNKLRFEIWSDIKNDNVVACNWVVLKVGDVYTLSGPQAPITVGLDPPDGCSSDGLFEVYKESEPKIIPPLVEEIVTYDIHIRNLDGSMRHIEQIDDFLPPGFKYLGPTSNLTDMEPHSENQTYNGVTRQHLWWDDYQLTASGKPVAAGANVTLTFRATALQGVSGSYYNEVMVLPNNVPPPTSFTTIDPDYEWSLAFSQTYSWNSGTIIVPAFDSETESDGETVHANLALSPLGVVINSWQVK